jgi:hypothetical protein
LNPRAPPIPPAGAISGGNGTAAAWSAGFEAGGAAAMAVVNGLSLSNSSSSSSPNSHHHHHRHDGHISSSSSNSSSNHSSRSNSMSHEWTGEETQLIVDEFGDEHPLPVNGSVVAAAALARASSTDGKDSGKDRDNGVDAAPLESPLSSLSSLSSSISPLTVMHDYGGKRARKMSRRMEESEAQAGGGIRAVMSMKHEVSESDSVPWNPPSIAAGGKRKQRPASSGDHNGGNNNNGPSSLLSSSLSIKRERLVPPPPPPPSSTTNGIFLNGHMNGNGNNLHMNGSNSNTNSMMSNLLGNGNRTIANLSSAYKRSSTVRGQTLSTNNGNGSSALSASSAAAAATVGGLDALLTALGPELPVSLTHPHILVPRPLLPGQLSSSPRSSGSLVDTTLSSLSSLPGQLMMSIAPSQSPPPIPSSLLPSSGKLDFRPSPPPVVSHLPSPRHLLLPSSLLPSLSPPPVQWSTSPASPHSPAPPASPRLPLPTSMLSPTNGAGTGHAFYRPLGSGLLSGSNNNNMSINMNSSHPASPTSSLTVSSSTTTTTTTVQLQLPTSFTPPGDLKRSSSGGVPLGSLTTDSGLTIGLEMLSPRGSSSSTLSSMTGTGTNHTSASNTNNSNSTNGNNNSHSALDDGMQSPTWQSRSSASTSSYSAANMYALSSPPPLSPNSLFMSGNSSTWASPGPSRGISGDSTFSTSTTNVVSSTSTSHMSHSHSHSHNNSSSSGHTGSHGSNSVASLSSANLSGHLGSLSSPLPSYSFPPIPLSHMHSTHSNSSTGSNSSGGGHHHNSTLNLTAPSPRSDGISLNHMLMSSTPLSSSNGTTSSSFGSFASPSPSGVLNIVTPGGTESSISLRSFAVDPLHDSTSTSASSSLSTST